MGGMVTLEGLAPGDDVRLERDLTLPNPARMQGGRVDESQPEHILAYRRDAAGRYMVPRYYQGVRVDRSDRGPWEPGNFTHRMIREPRAAQLSVVAELVGYVGHDVGMQLPCGFGKTYLALRHAAQMRGRILVVVPNEVKLGEWRREITEHMGVGIEDIGHVQAAVCRWRDCPITVVMLKTLAMKDLDPDFYSGFSAVIWDEVHLVPAARIGAALGRVSGQQIMLTATPGTGVRRTIIDLHGGGRWVLRVKSAENVHFHFQVVPVSEWVAKAGEWRYQKLRLAKDERYNRFAAQQAEGALRVEGSRLMVLHSLIEPLVAIQNHLRRRGHDGGGFVVGQGSLKDIRADEVMKKHPGLTWPKAAKAYIAATKESANPILATGLTKTQPGGVGMDVADLDSGIIMHPVGNPDMVQQIVGRWQREHAEKLTPRGLVMIPDLPSGHDLAAAMWRAMNNLGVQTTKD